MRRVLLLIESNTTGTGRQFAQCAVDLGVTPVLLTADPGRYAYVAQDGLEHVLIDTSDERAVLDRVQALAENWQIVGVTSSSEYYIATAAACARALGLPGPAPEAVRACRDKREQREILRAAGVAGPAFAAARTVAQVHAAGIPYPVVVKPGQGSGSVGVRLCADREQAEAHAARLLQAAGNERGLPVPAEILVEQYLTGSEHSVEVFRGRSVATVDKHLGPPPWFVETGHDTPSRLPADRVRLLVEAAEEAVAALGLDWGAVHVELRLGPDGARIVEVNPRLAGGMIPDLLRRAYGVDLIQAQVRAALGLPAELPGRALGSASIRFLMADRPGVVGDAVQATAAALAVDGVAAAELYRGAGATVEPAEDFRGRFGHVISASERTDGAAPAAADLGLARLRSALRDAAADDGDGDGDGGGGGVRTGRLSTALNPQAHAIVYGADPAADAAEELGLISEVDRAHLVMLTERGVIAAAHSARLLAQIERLRGTAFAQLRDRPMPRGVYLAYEGLLSELLGEEVGGVLHTGRSRNDLGATTVRLRAREHCGRLLDAVDALAESLLDRAVKYQDVVMPAYTHGQPAVPITFGHYLVGVAASVVRGYADLVAAGAEIEVNPLGAGAVGGTSVPIDPARTAELLGFTGVAVNSVDAVASRDFALRLLAGISTLGVTVTRVAHDLSVWTSEESGLLHLADDLVGSSSMMPQKRNPFLLEYIQGKASASLGYYVGAVSAMASAGYTNAIAVGTEAVRQLWPGLAEGAAAATLLRLVVDGATPDEQRMNRRAADGFTAATYLAERLVASGVPFRSAHHEVGRRVLAALDAGAPLDADGAYGTDLDPAAVAAASAYGGGPGGGTVVHAVDLLRERMSGPRGLLAARRGRWAEAAAMLDEAARSIVGAAEQP